MTAIVSQFIWNRPALPSIYVLTWYGMLHIDMFASKCEEIEFDWDVFGGEFTEDVLCCCKFFFETECVVLCKVPAGIFYSLVLEA